MSVKPCKFYDLTSGKPVLIGDYNDALDFLLNNPELMEAAPKVEKKEAPKKEEKEEKPKPKPKTTAKSYGDARDTIAKGANLTEAEIDEYLPAFLASYGISSGNKNTVNGAEFDNLLTTEPSTIADYDSEKSKERKMAEKIANYVRSLQETGEVKSMSAAEKVKAWTAAQREALRGTATSGGALYTALLDAIDAAVDAGQSLADAIAQFRSKYVNQQKGEAEKAIAYFKAGAPQTVRQQINAKKLPTKKQVQKIIDKAYAVGMGFGKQQGFQKGATEGGRAGFVTGKEEGQKEGFQKGATAGMKAGFVAGQEEGRKEGFQKGAIEGQKSGFVTGKEVGMEQGQEMGIKEGKLAAAKTMKVLLEGLKAELNPRQINALLDKLAKQRNFTPEGKQAFIDYANNVIDDANYVLNERAGNKLKGRVKTMSQSDQTPANDKSLFKAFAGLSINHMEPDVLDKYIEWGNMIVGKSLKNREALKQFILDQKAVQDAIIEERSEKMREGRERNLQEEYDRLKKEGELPDGVSTFEEYKESRKPTPKEKRNLKEYIDNLEIPEGTDPDTKKVIQTFKNQDLSILSSNDMALLENALTNFEDTGELFAAGDIAAKLEVWNAIDALPKFNRSVDLKDAKKLSLTNLFMKFFDTSPQVAKVRGVLIQPWLAKAGQVYEKFEFLSGKFMKEAARLKLNRDNINKIDLFGFLNERGGESFEELRDQKLSDLEMLKAEMEADKKSKDPDTASARATKQRYEALKKSIDSVGLTPTSTLESVASSMTPNEMRLYDVARRYLDFYAPAALRNMALYGNRDVEMIENYWPRNARRTVAKETQTPLGQLEDFSMYGGASSVGKNLFSRQKGRTGLIGKNGYYEPMGEMNFLNGLRETMFVAEGAGEYHKMQAVFNSSKGISKLMKGEGAAKVKEYLVDLVTDTKNSGRYAIDTRTNMQRFLRAAVDAATGAIIKRPSQLLKQPTALGVPLALAPEETAIATGIALKFMASKENTRYNDAVKNFISNSTLSFRLALPEHIEDNQQYAVDRTDLEKGFNKATKFLNKITLGESITDADKYVSIIATLAGYIQNQIQTGKLKKASDFDILKEDQNGWDNEAMAAGEQLQGRTNNENARMFFSQTQKDNPALYYLTNFTHQAVRGLSINARRAFNPNSSREEVAEAFRAMTGYLISIVAFSGATTLSNDIIYGAIQKIKEGLSDDDEEEKKRKRKMLEDYEKAQSLSRRDSQILREALSLGIGTQNILVQGAVNFAAAEAFQMAQKEVKAMEEKGELPEYLKSEFVSERTKKEYNPLYQSETIGAPGVMAEMLVKPIKRISGAESGERGKAAAQEAGILALNLARLSGPSDIVSKTLTQDRRDKKALEFAEKKLVEKAKAIMKPDEAEQKRSKELFKSAIETKDTKLASDALEKYIKAFPTKEQKFEALESILDSELSEKIPQSVGIKSEYVDDFFKLYYGAEVKMGRADSDRNYEITRMKKILENKAMTEDIVRKYEAEYEKAKATRDMLISLDIKNPESGRPMRVPTPSWMRDYEKNIAPQMPAKVAPVKKEETGFLKRLFK